MKNTHSTNGNAAAPAAGAMKIHHVRTLGGEEVTLRSDDTYSLALGPEMEETTPEFLGSTFSARTLRRIAAQYPAHASERTKIERALNTQEPQ